MRSNRYRNPFIRFIHNVGKSPLGILEGLQYVALFWVLTRTLIGYGGFLAYGEPMVAVSRDLLVLAGLHALVIAFRRKKHGLDWELLLPLPILFYGWFHYQVLSAAPWNAALFLTVFVQAYVLYFIIFNSLKGNHASPVPLLICQGVVVLAVLTAFFQFYQYPGWMVSLDRERNPDYLNGAAGFLLDPSNLGSLIVLIWPASVVIVLLKRYSGPVRAFNGFLILALIVGLILSSHAFGMIIPLVLMFILPFLISKRRMIRVAFFKYGMMILFFIIPVFWFTTDALRRRMLAFIETPMDALSQASVGIAWSQFMANPLFGNGLGSFPLFWESHRPEEVTATALYPVSSHAGTLAETGLIGWIGFLVLLGALFIRAFRVWLSTPYLVVKKDIKERMDRYPPYSTRRARIERKHGRAPSVKVILGCLLPGLLAFLVYIAWDTSLFLPLHLFLLACVLGSMAAYSRLSERRTVRPALGIATALVPLLLATWAAGFGVPKLFAQHLVYTTDEQMEYLLEDPDRIFLDPGSVTSAISVYRNATALNPGHAGAWTGLGRAWLARLHADLFPADELAREAIPHLERALKLNPDSWEANFEIARALSIVADSDSQLALSYLETAISMAPYRVEPLVYKASLLLLEDSRSTEGRELLARAEAIDAGYEPLQAMLSRLNMGTRGGRSTSRIIFTPALLAQQFDILGGQSERVLGAGIMPVVEEVILLPDSD